MRAAAQGKIDLQTTGQQHKNRAAAQGINSAQYCT
jgi:hypothetical protein